MMKFFQNFLNRAIVVNKTIHIHRDAYEFILETTKSSTCVETGGILMGIDIDSDNVEVVKASLPGPNAVRTPTKFLRDTAYCKDILLNNYNESGIDYVGEWHSHVCSLRSLSYGDVLTVSSIINDDVYDFKSFAVIVAVLNMGEVELIGYITSDKYINRAGILIEG